MPEPLKRCPVCVAKVNNGKAVCPHCDHVFFVPKPPINKGRAQGAIHRRGTANGANKLTVENVEDIRDRYVYGRNVAALAAEFKIHKRTVISIVNGETWGWLE